MNKLVEPENFSKSDFADLKLRAGAWLKVQDLNAVSGKFEVEFAAALQRKILFVTMPESASGKIKLQLGERYRFGGFNGVSDFSFDSTVLDIQTKPFVHVHLAYPDHIESKMVRRELRVNASIPAGVTFEGLSKPVSVNIRNISVAGASIESSKPLGEVGDSIELRFVTRFEAKQTELKLPAVIRHVSNPSLTGGVRSGVEFGGMSREDKLVLYYLLFTLGEAG